MKLSAIRIKRERKELNDSIKKQKQLLKELEQKAKNFKPDKKTYESTRRTFATTKIGKHPKEIKSKHIINGRLNQISLTYKTGKNKFTVSVIVKNKKDLKRKIKTLLNFPQNSGDIAKTKFISVERYLVRKKSKKK